MQTDRKTATQTVRQTQSATFDLNWTEFEINELDSISFEFNSKSNDDDDDDADDGDDDVADDDDDEDDDGDDDDDDDLMMVMMIKGQPVW